MLVQDFFFSTYSALFLMRIKIQKFSSEFSYSFVVGSVNDKSSTKELAEKTAEGNFVFGLLNHFIGQTFVQVKGKRII